MFQKHEIPSPYLKKWQKTVDLAAELFSARAAMVTRVWPERLEILVSSGNEGNPFSARLTVPLDGSHYCEEVMCSRASLLVNDARDDAHWQNAVEQAANMVCYYGVPLLWPDKTVFGTLCVLDAQPRQYARPLQLLLWQLKEIIEGDFRLIHYSRELDRRKAELEDLVAERTDHLRLLLDSTAEAIYGIDLQGRCMFCNPACLRLLGYTHAESLMGRDMHALIHHHHADGSPYAIEACPIWTTLLQGVNCHVDDEVLWRQDGSSFPAEYWAHPQRRGEKIVGAVITFLDITDRRRGEDAIRQLNTALEARVQERTQQLEALVHELETFSYSVSHDLRAPLRAIDGFSCILQEDFGQQLEEGGQFYLGRIRASVQLMGRLIDDLLELAKMSRSTPTRRQTDLSALARGILEDLATSDATRQVEIEVASTPPANCDPGLAQVILQNLLANAWKYTRKQAQARIEFASTLQEGRPVYFVRDNGAGFDMAYADQLYRPFSRLHGTKEFEGTGIGLATVKQAVTKHQGSIWTEAAPGAGATFFFTLEPA